VQSWWSSAIKTHRTPKRVVWCGDKQELLEQIQEISIRPSVSHMETFNDKFEFVGEVNNDLNCAVCREILTYPIETKREHCFCAGCLRQVVDHAGASVLCPV